MTGTVQCVDGKVDLKNIKCDLDPCAGEKTNWDNCGTPTWVLVGSGIGGVLCFGVWGYFFHTHRELFEGGDPEKTVKDSESGKE